MSRIAKYKDYTEYMCGLGWEVAARDAVHAAITHAKPKYAPHAWSDLVSAKIHDLCWVDALVYFLMGMKEEK